MSTPRKAATRAKKTVATQPRSRPAPQPKPLTEEQRQAKFDAYHALKRADLPIPESLAEVEGWISELRAQLEAEERELQAEADKQAKQIAEINQSGPWYVRNGYTAPFSLRLDRQTDKRRLQLQPRGMPGDLHPIKEEDLKDPILKQNLHLGVIEIIPAGEAALIMEKQTTNMGHRVHTPLAILRNEKDQPYAQGNVKIEAEFNSQGVTVAQVDPRVLTGELHDKEVKRSGGLQRGQQQPVDIQAPSSQPQQATSVVRSGFVPTGGNQAIIQYGPTGDNARAQIVDDLARRRGGEGPKAGLGDIQVVVEPVRQT